MSPLKKLFASGPKDECLTAVAAPAYKAGFHILAFGIMFDLWARFNYLAQTDVAGNVVQQARSGIYSDSLRFTEARTRKRTVGACAFLVFVRRRDFCSTRPIYGQEPHVRRGYLLAGLPPIARASQLPSPGHPPYPGRCPRMPQALRACRSARCDRRQPPECGSHS